MKQKKEYQPNFETIKSDFYMAFVDSEAVSLSISMENLCGNLLPSWYKRKEQFKKDFNQWLDRVDIRQAGQLIAVLKEQNKKVPKWAANNKYVIDYNEDGFLDLIRTDI